MYTLKIILEQLYMIFLIEGTQQVYPFRDHM